jgi:hypothetical protein
VSFLKDLRMYSRYLGGLPRFLRRRMTLEEAREILQRRLEQREDNFLRMVQKGIFGHPGSPYLPLMKMAQCRAGDIQGMVHSQGIEKTLLALREAGVYTTFEESKGRRPIERRDLCLPVKASDFDNPYLSPQLSSDTGGSTGARTRVDTDLDHYEALTPYLILCYHAQGVLDSPGVIWRGPLPDGSGISNILRNALIGDHIKRWFTLDTPGFRPAIKFRLAESITTAAGRLLGSNLPRREPLTLDGAPIVARWVSETLEKEGSCLVITPVSRALRICLAAAEEGIDLTGAAFMVAGEPLTPGKEKGIRASGAGIFMSYGLCETGRMGMGCGRPADATDVHFMKDGFALIPYPRRVPGTDLTVEAFNFTTLLPSAPKILLNAEVDDYGILEERACGCPLGELGFSDHLRSIRSFRKLTGEGVSLVGSELIRVLEEVLPERFGGSPLDYQLAEEEDREGFTRLNLLVSPKVGDVDEKAIIDTVYRQMKESGSGGDMTRNIWGQARLLKVKRMEPVWSSRGKLMPLHLAGKKMERT